MQVAKFIPSPISIWNWNSKFNHMVSQFPVSWFYPLISLSHSPSPPGFIHSPSDCLEIMFSKGGPNWQGGLILAAKIDLARPILAVNQFFVTCLHAYNKTIHQLFTREVQFYIHTCVLGVRSMIPLVLCQGLTRARPSYVHSCLWMCLL